MDQYYKIAGLTVKMNTFGRTALQAKPYLCQPSPPDIVIQSDWRALQVSQPHLSGEECEYLSSGSSFYRQLLRFDGLLLHSSAVVLDGWAYLFTAPSGTGKSTHTQLWLKAFGARAYLLNDDKPALRYENGAWFAYGTPWSGKYDISRNVRVPLAGICYLRRADENVILPMKGAEAVYCLLEQTVRPAGAELRGRLLALIDQLLSDVPVWQMGCNMDVRAAQVSYEAMSPGRKDQNL